MPGAAMAIARRVAADHRKEIAEAHTALGVALHCVQLADAKLWSADKLRHPSAKHVKATIRQLRTALTEAVALRIVAAQGRLECCL